MAILSLCDWGSFTKDRIHYYIETTSTNSDAFSAAERGACTGTWIIADTQFSGKGRAGRRWISLKGNLHASILLNNILLPSKVPQLSIVSGVAFHQAILEICDNKLHSSLELKWPNDIILNRCKLGGILIESSYIREVNSLNVVIGFGLNLKAHPETIDQPGTNLQEFGIAIKTLDFLKCLDQTLYKWVGIWSEDEGLDRIKEEWEKRSVPVGTSLMTKQSNGLIKGLFAGINNDGSLLLLNNHKRLEVISIGDVILDHPTKD